MEKQKWNLHYKSITLQYGGVTYLADWNQSINPGEQLVIYGGTKSKQIPLLFMLGGYLQPTRGKIYFEEGKRYPVTAHEVGLGPVKPFTPLFSSLRIEESLVQQGRLYAVRRPKRRAKWLLEEWELEPYRRERIQDVIEEVALRTSIAMALVHQPKVLLLHTPDKDIVEQVWENVWRKLLEKQEKDQFILGFSTFQLSSANRCTHAINLSEVEYL